MYLFFKNLAISLSAFFSSILVTIQAIKLVSYFFVPSVWKTLRPNFILATVWELLRKRIYLAFPHLRLGFSFLFFSCIFGYCVEQIEQFNEMKSLLEEIFRQKIVVSDDISNILKTLKEFENLPEDTISTKSIQIQQDLDRVKIDLLKKKITP